MVRWSWFLQWLLRPRPGAGARAQAARIAHAERIAHVGSWEVDLPANRLVYSDEALRIHGLTRGQFDGTLAGAIALAHPDDRLRLGAAINATLYEGKPFAIDYRIVRPDGSVRHVHVEDEIERDASGVPVRAFGITQDITERTEIEQALRDERRHLSLIADNVPAMIAYVDAERRYRYTNRRYRLFYAGGEPSIEGLRLEEVLTPETWQAVRPRIERAFAGETVSYSGERRLRDGSVRHVSVSLVPHRDEAVHEVRGLYILILDVTAQHQAQTALRESEAGLQHAQEMAMLAHVVVRSDGSYERWSENWPRLMGLDAARLPRSTREALELIQPQDRERFRAVAIEAARRRSRTVVDYRFRRADGAVIDVHQVMEPFDTGGAGDPHWFVTLQDVTEQKAAEERIRRLNRVYVVLSGINGAIVRIRDRQELFEEVCRIAVEHGRFRFAWICLPDARGERLVPAASAGEGGDFLERISERLSLRDDAPAGHGVASLAARERRAVFVNDVETSPLVLLKDLHRSLGIRAVGVLPILVDGRMAAVLGLHAPEAGFFDDDEQRLLRELAGDIAFALDHIAKEERVRYLAYYDQLTGLANRALFLERLAERLAAAAQGRQTLGLLLLNIDRFKTINDTLGRPAGDALLKEFARRLQAAAGDAALIARVGGDHFAVMLPDVKSDESLRRRLERGDASVKALPFQVAGQELRIATRSGVAIFPQDAADAESLYRNAEAALKVAQTGEMFILYRREMTERVAGKLSLENRLRSAIEKQEFVLHYQPKVELATRRVVGVEALIRWASAEGLVPPARFVPLLEETGLILQVGDWALAQAVADQRRWRGLGLPPLRTAVNVSAIQVRQADFVARLRERVGAGDGAGIELELTESLLMEDVAGNVAKLRAVRDLGVQIAIDDFGTGYSSLSYLTKLPVQSLKIDRSFVAAMGSDTDTMTLVSTVISLAHSLRLRVVAEGVESEEQATFLRLLRCDEIQGFLIARPMPAADLEAFLRRPA